MATAVITRLAEIREAYAQRRALWRELDSYVTEGSLDDIDAAIERSGTEGDLQTRQLRRIVSAKRLELLQRSY
jgi:hypothetical protein